MGLLNRVLQFIGFADEADDDRDEREERDTDSRGSYADDEASDSRRPKGTVVSIHSTKQSKVVLAQPDNLEDVKQLIEHLRARKAVIINLQHHKDPLVATRIGDKVHGAVFAFNGKMTTITNGIYMCTPDNYEVSGSIDISKEFVRGSHKDVTEESS